jgi:hypothetical protein
MSLDHPRFALAALAALAAALLAGAASAADVAVFPPQVVNLSPGQGEAIGTVLAQAYAHASNTDVLGPSQTSSAVTDPNHLQDAAAKLGVAEYIETSAVGLVSNEPGGSRIVIHATRRSQSGQAIFRAELTATSMGDVEIVAQRLARALFQRLPAEETIDIHSVTAKEAGPENRTFSRKLTGPKVGVIFPVSAHKSYDPMVALSWSTRLEGGSYFVEFATGIALPCATEQNGYDSQGIGHLWADVGGSLFLSNSPVAPYLGLGISPRLIVSNGATVNIAPYAQAGILMARTSSVHLFVEFRAAQNLLSVKETRHGVRTDHDFRPTELGGLAGISW